METTETMRNHVINKVVEYYIEDTDPEYKMHVFDASQEMLALTRWSAYELGIRVSEYVNAMNDALCTMTKYVETNGLGMNKWVTTVLDKARVRLNDDVRDLSREMNMEDRLDLDMCPLGPYHDDDIVSRYTELMDITGLDLWGTLDVHRKCLCGITTKHYKKWCAWVISR